MQLVNKTYFENVKNRSFLNNFVSRFNNIKEQREYFYSLIDINTDKIRYAHFTTLLTLETEGKHFLQ